MDKKIYLNKYFPIGSIPNYACPRCGSHMRSEKPDIESLAITKQNEHTSGFSIEDDESIFKIKMECTHPKCGEPIFMVGNLSYSYEEVLNERDDFEGRYIAYGEPKYFIPNLCIFKVPEGTPHSVAESINASFNLLFVSSGSALNEIRNAVEFLMDELGVPRMGPSEGDPAKQIRWDLHTRVSKLSGACVKKYKQHLLAIKSLGNWGSHSVVTSRGDVLDAYEILEYVLNGIYVKKDSYIVEITRRVRADKRSSI